MLNPNVPPFDAILSDSTPYIGFGAILPEASILEGKLRQFSAEARERLENGFEVNLADPAKVPKSLDQIVADMWSTGWNPIETDVNIFARDFGGVLSVVILDIYGGEPIFRSETDMSHFSIWWSERRFEAFPFHNVLKCLFNQFGESMEIFVGGIAHRMR